MGKSAGAKRAGSAVKATSARTRQVKKAGDADASGVGKMLRNAYHSTVEEVIPQELLDLLNKLE